MRTQSRSGGAWWLTAISAALLSVSCGGGSSHAPPPERPGADDPELASPDKGTACEQALTRVQESNEAEWQRVVEAGPPKTLEEMAAAACQVYCGRTTECAVDEACVALRAGKGDDIEVKDFESEVTDRHTKECLDSCNSWSMTKKQIQVLGNCAQADSDCATFRSCTADLQSK